MFEDGGKKTLIHQINDMDTVQEENSSSDEESSHSDIENLRLKTEIMAGAGLLTADNGATHSTSQPTSRRMSTDVTDSNIKDGKNNGFNTRRPSAIIAAFRRPSQALALCAATQKKFLSELIPRSSEQMASNQQHLLNDHLHCVAVSKVIGDDAFSKALSALYAKLLVVLGLTFPVTEVISERVTQHYYQAFYLYLYLVSIIFILFTFGMIMKNKAKQEQNDEEAAEAEKAVNNSGGAGGGIGGSSGAGAAAKSHQERITRYGSFYLRLGAMAFGIGSMVYSGLELGDYLEGRRCRGIVSAFTPSARVALTLLQMQFIFLSNKEIESCGYRMVQRFGLMHMLAMNLCEWLYVLVAETEHEIHHLQHTLLAQSNITHGVEDTVSTACVRSSLMGGLLQTAAPFLFPCTVEYSLICAVILYEMWKEVKCTPEDFEKKLTQSAPSKQPSRANSVTPEKILQQFAHLMGVGQNKPKTPHHLSVDCSQSARGIFAGVFLVVLVIISLIMFFVLVKSPETTESAIFEVNVVEIGLCSFMLIATMAAYWKMRLLSYKRKAEILGLDTSLLMLAQTGVFVYCMFSLTGSYFTLSGVSGAPRTSLAADFVTLVQTITQSLFIVDAWWRRCRHSQRESKPGRQLVTFLLVGNMAAWVVNTLEKNRAEFRPAHLEFYGPWAWTVLTHASMPLAIFYRFHSTICLFEIWKNAYKSKPIYLNV